MRTNITCGIALLLGTSLVWAQAGEGTATNTSASEMALAAALKTIERLNAELAMHEARLRDLERRATESGPTDHTTPTMSGGGAKVVPAVYTPTATETVGTSDAATPSAGPDIEHISAATSEEHDPHDHMIQLGASGPQLKMRGFFDFNFGLGSNTNTLVYPLSTPARSAFQMGEFDLFFSSKLSSKLNFISELVIGPGTDNTMSPDLERFQLTYRPSRYFEIGGGRYHTSIGYYNTAYHHGLWFQTAAGRPFMYFFEDSGGLLPVHALGITSTGEIPGSGQANLHWIAELSNGRASDPAAIEPVQNFVSDRTSKAYNLALYSKPTFLPGLQVGGSYYRDRLYPGGIGIQESIASAYAVYINSGWEILAEGVSMTNTITRSATRFTTPMTYAQVSRKFGIYRPFVRYQFVDSPALDPANLFHGKYVGPSVGVRLDLSEYMALKLQYNRLDLHAAPANGLDLQMAFTF